MKLNDLADYMSESSNWGIVNDVQSAIAEYIVMRGIAESKYNNILSMANESDDFRSKIVKSKALDIAFDYIHILSDLYACRICNIVIRKYGDKNISSTFSENRVSLDLSSFYKKFKDLENALGENYKDKDIINGIIRSEAYKFCFERSLKDDKTV